MIRAQRKGEHIFRRETLITIKKIPTNYDLKVRNKVLDSLLPPFGLFLIYFLKLVVNF